MEVPQNAQNRLTIDAGIPLLGIYPKKTRFLIHKDICTPMFITALFRIAKNWKQPKCPSIDEWIKKKWYTYSEEYNSAIRKKEILPFVTTWMDLEGTILSGISWVEKDKYHRISLSCGILRQTKQKDPNSGGLIHPGK